ncbi:DUF2058 family protein [Simiduia litorea]|uniref:DUF2058 domain-containing protein n=1 Tax=Simiduia litorea TaxID=1435348 RepID=UPI0036F1BFB1
MTSLQDQLLKAGLIDGKKAKQIGKDKRKQNKVAKKSSQPQLDETKLAVEQARAEKVAKDRELNAERNALAEQKAIAAQIKQLIATNKQPKGGGDIAYNFTFDKKIKKIYVSADVQAHLIAGRLVIAGLDDKFELVPRVIAEKITERNPAMIIQAPVQTQPDLEDDPYADYQIPDDLMW